MGNYSLATMLLMLMLALAATTAVAAATRSDGDEMMTKGAGPTMHRTVNATVSHSFCVSIMQPRHSYGW